MPSSTASNDTANVLWLQFIFLISGISQTVLVNLISYHGGASPSTLLPVFLSYLASASTYFLPKDKTNHTHNTQTLDTILSDTPITSPNRAHSNLHKRKLNPLSKISKHKISQKFALNNIINTNELKIMFLALYDLLCAVISFLALVWSGSAVYQLVYSSIIIITATFRHFLLPNKKLSFKQWIACFIVTFGLFLSGFGQNEGKKHKHYSMLSAFSQLVWPLIATMLFAIEYVLIEKILQDKNAPSDNELCYKMGFYGLTFVCLYQLLNVIPNWDTLFVHEITIHNGSKYVIVIAYCFVFISQYLHNWSYFILLHTSGAVSTGINQALRAVGVFIISGVFFCELQQSQCFNSFKFLSLIIVIIGVLRYAFLTAMYKHNKNGELYIMSIDEKNKHVV